MSPFAFCEATRAACSAARDVIFCRSLSAFVTVYQVAARKMMMGMRAIRFRMKPPHIFSFSRFSKRSRCAMMISSLSSVAGILGMGGRLESAAPFAQLLEDPGESVRPCEREIHAVHEGQQ